MQNGHRENKEHHQPKILHFTAYKIKHWLSRHYGVRILIHIV